MYGNILTEFRRRSDIGAGILLSRLRQLCRCWRQRWGPAGLRRQVCRLREVTYVYCFLGCFLYCFSCNIEFTKFYS